MAGNLRRSFDVSGLYLPGVGLHAGGVAVERGTMSDYERESWLACALARSVVLRGLRVAVVVGTVLALINYGDRLVAGLMTGRDWLKLVLTYAVPYGVAIYSSVSALRARD